MAIDITGITNENEFYSHHYLAAIFESDIKEVFNKWNLAEKEKGERPPYALLRGQAREYFKFRRRLERVKMTLDRLQLQRQFLEPLLGVLGYPLNPCMVQLDNSTEIPLAAQVTRSNGAPELWVLEVLNDKGETE
ncbi:MAG: hypothetical protein GY940_22245, partial [bacterium]|nr:hypothetical protein [bacterium]